MAGERARRSNRRPPDRALASVASYPFRVVACLLLVGGAGAALTVCSVAYRGFEARLVSLLIGPLTETGHSGTAFRVVGDADDQAIWFTVTPECTSALLIVPLVAFAAWALLQHKFAIGVVLIALAAGFGIVLLLNTARMGLVGLGWHQFGGVSYWTTHSLIGTVISLCTVFVALVIQLRLSVWRDRAVRRTFDDVCEVADG